MALHLLGGDAIVLHGADADKIERIIAEAADGNGLLRLDEEGSAALRIVNVRNLTHVTATPDG